MRTGTYFCEAEKATATAFCACGRNPVYLCVTCVPGHKDNSGHDVFPMACWRLYQALGYNKVELKNRIETVSHCYEFLDKATAREAAVMTEANTLVNDLVRAYQGWLEQNHCCFNNLVEVLREEIASLLTAPEVVLSTLSQILVERIELFTGQEENILCSIPEENSLKTITQHCSQALAKTRRAQQQEYDNGVQEALMKLPVQQIPRLQLQAPLQMTAPQRIGLSPQMTQAFGQRFQQFLAPQNPLQMVQTPGQQVQQFPSPRFSAQPQMFQAPEQKVKQAPIQGDVHKLPCVQGDSLRFFDFDTKQWSNPQRLSTAIPFTSETRYTVLGDSRVFCCGSVSNIYTDNGKAANILARDGAVERLKDMINWHIGAGIVFVANRNSIYVFGEVISKQGVYSIQVMSKQLV